MSSLLRSGRRLVGNLSESGPNQAKSDRTVQFDGRTVLSGRFQEDSAQASRLKADQRLQNECSAESQTSVFRANADILHRSGVSTVGQTLNSSAVDWIRIRILAVSANQPCRLWKKRSLAGDFEHQPPASIQRRQRRKHQRIQLVLKAGIFGDSVTVEIFRLPADEAVPVRQLRIGNFVLGKIEFHSESTEIPHDHSRRRLEMQHPELNRPLRWLHYTEPRKARNTGEEFWR